MPRSTKEQLDLTTMTAKDAAHALFQFICMKAREAGMDPNIECALLSPRQGVKGGYGPFWRVMWEAGPHEWGVLLTLGESMYVSEENGAYDGTSEVKMLGAHSWYGEPHYSFDVGFISDAPQWDFDLDEERDGKSIIQVSGLVGQAIIEYFHKYPERMKQMDRRQFEEMIAELFVGFGYDVELTGQTRDGGKDIVAVKRLDEVSLKYLIECKRPDPGNYVSVSPVRELLGVKNSERATKGLLVTTAHFSPDALRILEQHRWEIEGKVYSDIVGWIRNYINIKTGRS